MILLAGVGLEADMVHAADREMKDALGPLAYIVAGGDGSRRVQCNSACMQMLSQSAASGPLQCHGSPGGPPPPPPPPPQNQKKK